MNESRETIHTEKHVKVGGLLKEAVFGFNDGLVSTLAVIAGLTGGFVEQKTVLLAALATLTAGAFSMGLGTYLGSKSERELYESERKRELFEMKHMPEIERQEIYDIYSAKGFKGKLLDEVVAHIVNDPKLWLETMMREELGFAEAPPKPGMNGIIMSISFVVGSTIPTASYFFNNNSRVMIDGLGTLPFLFLISLVASCTGLLLAGILKTYFTKKNIFASALESLIVGVLAAAGTYGVGILLS